MAESQLAELRLLQQRIQVERDLLGLRTNPASASEGAPEATVDTGTAINSPSKSDRIRELESRLRDTEQRLAAVGNGTAGAKRGASELGRNVQLPGSPKVATVVEYVEDPDFGNFAVITIQTPESVQAGTVLDLRRNGGIVGRVRVGEVTGSEAIVDPIAGSFVGGRIIIDPGDGLVVPPER